MARRSLVRGGGHSEDRPRFHSEPRAGGGTIQERKLSKTDRADERYELALLMPSNSESCQTPVIPSGHETLAPAHPPGSLYVRHLTEHFREPVSAVLLGSSAQSYSSLPLLYRES